MKSNCYIILFLFSIVCASNNSNKQLGIKTYAGVGSGLALLGVYAWQAATQSKLLNSVTSSVSLGSRSLVNYNDASTFITTLMSPKIVIKDNISSLAMAGIVGAGLGAGLWKLFLSTSLDKKEEKTKKSSSSTNLAYNDEAFVDHIEYKENSSNDHTIVRQPQLPIGASVGHVTTPAVERHIESFDIGTYQQQLINSISNLNQEQKNELLTSDNQYKKKIDEEILPILNQPYEQKEFDQSRTSPIIFENGRYNVSEHTSLETRILGGYIYLDHTSLKGQRTLDKNYYELDLLDALEVEHYTKNRAGYFLATENTLDRTIFYLENLYKIHIMPKDHQHTTKFITVLLDALSDDQELAATIAGIKIIQQSGQKTSDGDLLPTIVIYPALGKEQVFTCLKKIIVLSKDYAIEGLSEAPRFNYPITPLIYIAQGNGDQKDNKLFDKACNKAFFKNGVLASLKEKIITSITPKDALFKNNNTDLTILRKSTNYYKEWFDDLIKDFYYNTSSINDIHAIKLIEPALNGWKLNDNLRRNFLISDKRSVVEKGGCIFFYLLKDNKLILADQRSRDYKVSEENFIQESALLSEIMVLNYNQQQDSVNIQKIRSIIDLVTDTFKLHVMPASVQDLNAFITSFMYELNINEELRKLITTFKIKKFLSSDLNDITTYSDQDTIFPTVIIYVVPGKENTLKAAKRINEIIIDNKVKGSGIIPRYNYPLSEALFIAQGNADEKNIKSNFKHFFDSSTNYAFYNQKAFKIKCSEKELEGLCDAIDGMYKTMSLDNKVFTEWSQRYTIIDFAKACMINRFDKEQHYKNFIDDVTRNFIATYNPQELVNEFKYIFSMIINNLSNPADQLSDHSFLIHLANNILHRASEADFKGVGGRTLLELSKLLQKYLILLVNNTQSSTQNIPNSVVGILEKCVPFLLSTHEHIKSFGSRSSKEIDEYKAHNTQLINLICKVMDEVMKTIEDQISKNIELKKRTDNISKQIGSLINSMDISLNFEIINDSQKNNNTLSEDDFFVIDVLSTQQ